MWALGWPIAVSMCLAKRFLKRNRLRFCRFAMFSMDSACVGQLKSQPLKATKGEDLPLQLGEAEKALKTQVFSTFT